VEGKKWDLSFGDVDSLLTTMHVENLDVEVVGEDVVVNREVLSVPLWVLASVNTN
jgi:hypothetical protein